ncbi:MAG: NADH-quinone oxidoreductase subunit N [Bacteroidetes bacterium]|nr:NADH-quinone oxidoreductase subunit N [Bacteroidota bacterium]
MSVPLASLWRFALEQSLAAIAPELFLTVLLLAVLVIDLFRPQSTRLVAGFVSLGGLLALLIALLIQGPPARSLLAFDGMLQIDKLGWYFRLLLAGGHVLVLLQSFSFLREGRYRAGEFFVLLLGMHTGLSLMAQANHFLLAFLAMEMASVCGYVLTAWVRDDRTAADAGLKYMLYGVFSSGVMLFGLSLVYGLGGTLRFDELTGVLHAVPAEAGLVALSLVFAGFAYKAGLVPFHFWVPDVYQAAPYPVAALLSGMGKVGAFALLLRWFLAAPPAALWDGLWLQVLVILAIVSMLWGNLAAWGQTHYRRLLAYSSIGHSGLMLLAVAVGGTALQAGLGYYLLVYLILTYGVFMAGQLLLPWGESMPHWSKAGTAAQAPVLLLAVLLPALAGLPPTAGFTAKLGLFIPLWEAYTQQQNPWILAGLGMGVLTTLLGLYYYLRPLIYLIFRREAADTSLQPQFPGSLLLAGILLAIAVLYLGLFHYDRLLNWLGA